MKPLIAVTSDLKFIEPYQWHATAHPYIDALVHAAGAIPLIVPSLEEALDIDGLLDRVDGVLVTGSRSNVHPENYNQTASEDHAPFDRARDATTLPLIRRAVERGVPLLAICRGIQEMNVAYGGSITAAFQKNRNLEDHGYPWEGTLDERFSLAHEIDVKAGSCLHDIVKASRINVNSLHTQALDRVAEGLDVEATADDGTIEAVTVKGARGFALGVQWHPEYWATSDQPSNAVLTAFADAARAHAARFMAGERTPVAAE